MSYFLLKIFLPSQNQTRLTATRSQDRRYCKVILKLISNNNLKYHVFIFFFNFKIVTYKPQYESHFLKFKFKVAMKRTLLLKEKNKQKLANSSEYKQNILRLKTFPIIRGVF